MTGRWILAVTTLLLCLPTAAFAGNAAVGTCADFESGALPGYMFAQMTSSGAANGRVQVTTQFPHTGTWALDLDTDCNGCGGATQQAAIMIADLAGESHPQLRFWVHEHGDENNPEDGVFISDNGGITFAQALSLNSFPSSYRSVRIDLEETAIHFGMNLIDGFLIKFQSLDNFSIPTDGYSFDDICILAPDVFRDSFETGDLTAWSSSVP